MASTLLADLWGTAKSELKGQGNPGKCILVPAAFWPSRLIYPSAAVSDTKSVAEMDVPAFRAPTRTWTLPTELWIKILEEVPRSALAQVMLVNHLLSEVAEGVLYRSVSLKWNTL